MNEFTKLAKDFLKETNTRCTISYIDTVQNPWNATDICKYWRHNRYRVRLDRNNKTYSFIFTDSYSNCENNKRPTCYDVLACLQKYEPYWSDVFEFAEEFGYEFHSREDFKRVEKIFKAVCKEYKNVDRLFHDVMEKLAEIN